MYIMIFPIPESGFKTVALLPNTNISQFCKKGARKYELKNALQDKEKH